MTTNPPAPAAIRQHLCLALDVDDLVEALRLARDLQPWFGTAKVGLELFSASGPEAIGTLIDLGYDVFLDLKLHDIPTTVHKAAKVLGSLGAGLITLHAQGGVAMLRAGVEGLAEGAANAGLAPPSAIAVTVLTSDDGAPPHIVPNRIAAAIEARCAGIVCAGADVREARQLGPRLRIVVPGIRPAGAARHDQARATTPSDALAAGADLLVVGRAVTQADDPRGAAAAMAASLG